MRRSRRAPEAPDAAPPAEHEIEDVLPPGETAESAEDDPLDDEEAALEELTRFDESGVDELAEPYDAEPAEPVADLPEDGENERLQAELERGRTVALLAVLGRMQLSLDLLERRAGRIEQRLAALEERLP